MSLNVFREVERSPEPEDEGRCFHVDTEKPGDEEMTQPLSGEVMKLRETEAEGTDM
jgi:hypothetical protein